MVLDMGPMLRGEIRRMEIDYPLSPDEACDKRISGEISVKGEITDEGGYMHLTLSAKAPYRTECARCLSTVEGVFSVELERTVAVRETLTREQLEENVDEFAVIENGKLDLDETVLEELVLCFPMRFLCREDCPGLCPKCGKPLSEGACSCKTQEIDPRWKVLEGLFDKK